MIEKYLEDNNLIIAPNSLHKKIILEINGLDKLVSYKIMSLDQFMENYAFSYNKMTIYFIMKKFSISYEIALEYLKNLYFIEDKKYTSLKLNNLVSLKKELFANNLITSNSIFLDYLKNTNIIIYGYDLDPFYLNIFNKPSIDEDLPTKELSVLEFNDINAELNYIVADIRKNLEHGVDINTIKIVNSGSEYLLPLKRIFSWVNIPINLNTKRSLYDLEVGKEIISYLKKDLSFDDIISKLSNCSTDILNKVINIFNEYSVFDIDKEYLIKMIIFDLKNTYLVDSKLDNAVSLCDIDSISDGDTIYLVGFNKENYPKISKDEDFLSDNMKKELGLFTSNELNRNSKKKLINYLYRNVNYVITYKLRDAFNDFNPCLLIEELNMKVIKDSNISFNFSNFFNQMNLAIYLDNYRKYGIIDDNLKRLYATYNIPYNTYDNNFTGLDNKYFISSLDKLGLSYTKINDYFKCQFRYYLAYILNVEVADADRFMFDVGNIFHYVLSHYRDLDFSFDKLWNEEASKCKFSIGQLVLLNNLKDELKYDIEIIKKQENYSTLDKYYFEKDVCFKIPNSKLANLYFSGKIDKIIYGKANDTDNTIVSVIDYKTGNLPKDFNDTYYGIGMQLPIYTYLIKKAELFPNTVIAGFYLQKIINKDELRKYGKDMALEKEKKLRLFGYSNSSNSIISAFDRTYLKSEYISSLAVKNDGEYYSYSRVLSNEDINKLADFVESKVMEASAGILDASFKINPKRKLKEDSCSLCPYKDICFRKEANYVDLLPQKEFAFLGGEDNA